MLGCCNIGLFIGLGADVSTGVPINPIAVSLETHDRATTPISAS